MKSQNLQTSQIRDSNLSWTDPIQIQGAFGNASIYTFGTPYGQDKPEVFKKNYLKVNISKQKFIQRVNQLQGFSHENYVKVSHRKAEKEKERQIKQEFVKEFTVISEYVESIPVSTFIRQKKQIYLSSLISIVQQMTNLMVFAENKHIFHYHLNADSFLLIQSDSGSSNEIFVRICDWGYQNQICSRKEHKKLSSFLKRICQNSMFQYLHPQLLFEQNNEALYKEYKSKYDIWSFGIILYRLAYFKRPFQFKGSFSPQVLENFYKGKKTLQIQNKTLLGNLIGKMLDLKGFKSWSQIKIFLIQNAERSQTDFLQIKQLFEKEMNLICYLIEVYKLVAWNIVNSSNIFWYENKAQMKLLLVFLLKIIVVIHSKKFLQRYGHRMIMLSGDQKREHKNIEVSIEKQWKRKGSDEANILQCESFFEDFDQLTQVLMVLKLRINDYSCENNEFQRLGLSIRKRQITSSIKVLGQFSEKVLEVRKKMGKLNRNIFHNLYQTFTN